MVSEVVTNVTNAARATPSGGALEVLGLTDVSKTYSLTRSPIRRLAENLFARPPRESKEALAPITLRLAPGQSIGLIGKNGAGKSTLLQIAAGVIAPSRGIVKKTGRIAALLELGAGLLPDLTGRENIHFAGPLWGLTAKEIESDLPKIIAFSELGNAIDLPLRTYSSGMVVRLAFSMATATRPALLIIDEALSVGDGAFAQKSFDRIMELKKQGASLLFCSHSLYQVGMLCEQAIWLHEGRCMQMADAASVCRAYRNFLDRPQGTEEGSATNALVATQAGTQAKKQKALESAAPSIESITLLRNNAPIGNVARAPEVFISRQDDLAIRIQIRHPQVNSGSAQLAILIKDDANRVISSLSTLNDGFTVSTTNHAGLLEQTELTVTFKSLSLLKGQYRIDVILMCDRAIRFIETIADALSFEVTQTDKEIGVVSLPHEWTQR
jgi:lipopolysaccharide transport system ATP-binding protein